MAIYNNISVNSFKSVDRKGFTLSHMCLIVYSVLAIESTKKSLNLNSKNFFPGKTENFDAFAEADSISFLGTKQLRANTHTHTQTHTQSGTRRVCECVCECLQSIQTN